MAILHGSWINKTESGYLFIWGETWRRITQAPDDRAEKLPLHPLAMTREELISFLGSQKIATEKFLAAAKRSSQKSSDLATEGWTTQAIALPTLETDGSAAPLYSSTPIDDATASLSLQLWEVEGFCLHPLEAIEFLRLLPLGSFQAADSYVGADLRFWVHVCRWTLDLLARGKFLPGLRRQPDGSFVAIWQPLLDSTIDRTRLENFAQIMPAACRAYGEGREEGEEGEERGNTGTRGRGDAQKLLNSELRTPNSELHLLLSFLRGAIDAQVRAWINNQTLPAGDGRAVSKWLKALCSLSPQGFALTDSTPSDLERLESVLQAWTMPLQEHLIASAAQGLGQNLFRTCFQLQPPAGGETDWTLNYCLQAADNPDFLVDAAEIWQHPIEFWEYRGRTIARPQETFLKGLGLALRLYPRVEESLQQPQPQSCRLDAIAAYEFVRGTAWRLQDNGLGVVMPPSLMPGTSLSGKLGLKIQADVADAKGRLGLQSLLKFNLELAIGDRTVSKKEFDRLMALKTPLVEVNGEWIALQPQDVRAAEAILAIRPEQLSLSVEDALRLSTGDSKTIEKLPVVSFAASGVLEELINHLTNNQAIAPIEPPESFRGQLRPYQARGAGWLSFLEQWGLGACLADDMGLGKCISADSLVFGPGVPHKAEEIWQVYAEETEFDGEGFWTTPTASLLVNAIDESTGKIVLAPIQRLYRQYVQEKLRIITLKDGSSITITQRHKLLTDKGWTNSLQVGDWVGVPAKMLWNGQPEDADLIKFLAWQIAEGYEGNGNAVTISQNNTQLLEDLLQTLQRLGKRYSLKINCPSIVACKNKVPALRVTSKAYRQFLEAKGYCWGKRSHDKSIPPFIMQANLDSIRIFLRNYFDTESAVISSMRSIEISSASPYLIEQLSVLLRRFGIWLRIAPKQKCATNGTGIFRTYYIGTLGGNSARRFLVEIGFGNPDKQQKLQEICQKVNNTNVEGVPTSDIFALAVKQTQLPLRHFGIHSNVYTNGSQQFSRTSLAIVLTGIDRIIAGITEQEYRQLKPSKWTGRTLAAYAQLDRQQLKVTRQELQMFLDREVFYCQIKSIQDLDYEGWVYDFEVREHHNFVANNIICHNTIQFIAFMLYLQEQEVLEKPTLIVCPTSVLGNWEREVRKFGPTLKTLVHHGDKRAKGKEFAKAVKGKDLVISSYSLAYRDAKTLESISWQGVVLDEAQNIKNSEAKQSQAVRQLSASFRIALTGTPVENRLSELWSILDFLNPGYLGNRQFFQRRFAMPIEKYGDTASLRTLRSLVQPFILRRLKTDRTIIQDLPEKQEMNVFCGLTAEQAALYQKNVDESLVAIEESEGIQRRGLILTLLMKLKQICNHPAHFLKENTLVSSQRSGKLQRLEEMLEEIVAEGDRALIFTQFAEMGKLLQPYLEKQLGEETLFLYGGTRKPQREEAIDRFLNDPAGPKIFILSLKAGGTGLNLTRANHVFHFDRWWNPAVENQATDRVFRIGQTRNVQVHKFVCSGTLEEKINETIESKKQLAEQTVDAGEQWLTEMDTDKLRSLLLLDRSAVIDEE